MAAAQGNNYAAKAKRWQKAIERALARASNSNIDAGLDKGADALVSAFMAGEKWAIEEVGNRLDGKSAQSLTVSGDPENPLQVKAMVELVRPNP